jgi:hypothetical protein
MHQPMRWKLQIKAERVEGALRRQHDLAGSIKGLAGGARRCCRSAAQAETLESWPSAPPCGHYRALRRRASALVRSKAGSETAARDGLCCSV